MEFHPDAVFEPPAIFSCEECSHLRSRSTSSHALSPAVYMSVVAFCHGAPNAHMAKVTILAENLKVEHEGKANIAAAAVGCGAVRRESQ